MDQTAQQAQHEAWLKALNPGDEVCVRKEHATKDARFGTVIRRTPTLIIVDLRGQEFRYTADKGEARGTGQPWPERIFPVTAAVVDAHLASHAITQINIMRREELEKLPMERQFLAAAALGRTRLGLDSTVLRHVLLRYGYDIPLAEVRRWNSEQHGEVEAWLLATVYALATQGLGVALPEVLAGPQKVA